ncbi:Long-chain-fatty-acid--CoA ligase [Actinokineospora sp. NPDC004072]
MQILTTAEHPDLMESAKAALRSVWPEFIRHDPASNTHRDAVKRYFPEFNILLVADGEVWANAVAVALRWDGEVGSLPEGYTGALTAAVAEHEAGLAPDTLCVMSATVVPDRARGGLAGAALTALRERAQAAGLQRVIVPVRPTLKASYPLTPMADFQRWTRDDGLHIDPWIRTHQRLGAVVLGPAPRSMTVTGTVAQWEEWTGMAFPQSGSYVVPGALEPVAIDRDADQGVYHETNLWMRHR